MKTAAAVRICAVRCESVHPLPPCRTRAGGARTRRVRPDMPDKSGKSGASAAATLGRGGKTMRRPAELSGWWSQ